ncbi:MAG: hypothetical protein AB8G96_05950 [Phycisphaerales bacterium]
MNNQLAARTIRGDDVINEVREALLTWDDPDEALITSTLEWITSIRDRFAKLLDDIDDPTDAEMALAIKYIELKAQWIGFNTQINYQVFRTGVCDTTLAFRATACSSLLGQVEDLLDQGVIHQITVFLAQPIRKAA